MENQQKTTNETNRSKNELILIFFIMLMDVIGMSILGPVAPYIVKQYSGNALMVTMLTVIYSGALFVAAPAFGKISDRIGRRPVLLASVFGSAIGYFIFGIGGSLWILFLARLIDGITGGNMSTASAYIADISKPEERTKNFTLVGMSYGLGFIIGPALGGVLGQINLYAPVVAAGIVSLVSVLFIYFNLPESLPQEKRVQTPLKLNDFNPFASILDMARKPGLGIIILVSMLFNFTFDGINSTLGLFSIDKFAALPWAIGMAYLVSGMAIALGQVFLVKHLVKVFGERKAGMISLFGSGLGDMLLFFAPFFWMLFPIVGLQMLILSPIFSIISTLAVKQVAPNEQGQLSGVMAAVNGLVAALGPLWAGLVYDHVMVGSPLWMGAMIYGLAGVLIFFVREKKSQNMTLIVNEVEA